MKIRIYITILLFTFQTSCKNYYNDMIDWTSSIPVGTSIDSVKKLQPEYLEIDWSSPQKYGDETRYTITKIKNDNDLLEMENYLSFINDKYQGRFGHK